MQKLKDFFKENIILTIGIIALVLSLSNLVYGSYQNFKENKEEEVVSFENSLKTVARSLDTNVGSRGSGSNGDYGGAIGNSSITGTVRDEGVRVTLVKAETGEIITRPIDFANNPMPVTRSFGWIDNGKHVKICKLQYLKGTSLQIISLTSVGYEYVTPSILLPTIVNGNLDAIKKYFSDDWFIGEFSSLTGVSKENLTSGDYKLIIEPIGYPKINGVYYAYTATEFALFDQLLKNVRLQ